MSVIASAQDRHRHRVPNSHRDKMVMPAALKRGDKVAIVSPASTPADDNPEDEVLMLLMPMRVED